MILPTSLPSPRLIWSPCNLMARSLALYCSFFVLIGAICHEMLNTWRVMAAVRKGWEANHEPTSTTSFSLYLLSLFLSCSLGVSFSLSLSHSLCAVPLQLVVVVTVPFRRRSSSTVSRGSSASVLTRILERGCSTRMFPCQRYIPADPCCPTVVFLG